MSISHKYIEMARRIRSFAKAMTWRIGGSAASLAVAYLFTGDVRVSGAIGMADFVLKTVAYYIHERVWAGIEWGRSYRHEAKPCHQENS